MENKPHQADNITMAGGGVYSLATPGARDVIDIATPIVLDTPCTQTQKWWQIGTG